MKNKRIILSLLAVFLLIGLVGCGSNEDKDNNVPPVVETNDEDKEDETEEDEVNEDKIEGVDDVDQMIDEAKYISKVKLITKGDKGSEIKVLDNIKDVLSASDLPELALEENRVYLVFLKEFDGKVVLVDNDDGLVLLEGDNHELFEKINKKVHR